MFSGIVEAMSRIEKKEKKNGSLFLTIKKPKGWRLSPGNSICSDGACLTVKKVGQSNYVTELMPETLDKTYFDLVDYKCINLERSLKLNSVLDGHLVTGHVDVVGKIAKIEQQGNSKVYKISFPKKFTKYVVEKGSIAVDGISLTVVKVGANYFTISLVDFTLQNTTIGQKQVGDFVHLEFDILAKYLEKLTRQ
ncbi:MAG: Riboflavin biosynthesis protein [Candidatus Magasanikbacteria bacterium GW2011_GWC2_34_16]|uniref:Riboflavin synthase n=2 Tax=Candidatus Magasanikiibacteriota TaxID=1752731 RepID=A0A0G0JR20_9BACT|nr:MAG: Riboflavin biosynthesis protein [Candidatus Magasanikbacteria bacterium GW2011_GWC2_34_16]KKQ39354.1 MAG: Riboflavin biosynthesis protein [Candidatus Magasanikbacteria bacterium GW2011_GWA2_37_8]